MKKIGEVQTFKLFRNKMEKVKILGPISGVSKH